jgi:hypothetical protein
VAIGVWPPATGVESETPRRLFPVSRLRDVGSPYDVTSDGQQLLVLQPPKGGRAFAPLTLVVNCQAGLEQ